MKIQEAGIWKKNGEKFFFVSKEKSQKNPLFFLVKNYISLREILSRIFFVAFLAALSYPESFGSFEKRREIRMVQSDFSLWNLLIWFYCFNYFNYIFNKDENF